MSVRAGWRKSLGASLEVELTYRADGAGSATLSGQIDETADLSPLGDVKGLLVLDLAGVSYVNSTGVRAWVRLLRKLRNNGTAVSIRRCSICMVMQMSFVEDAKAKVESFYAPYSCARCGSDGEPELVDCTTHRGDLEAGRFPTRQCPRCAIVMTPDEDPESYLLFLSE